jgi:hypothetical protein
MAHAVAQVCPERHATSEIVMPLHLPRQRRLSALLSTRTSSSGSHSPAAPVTAAFVSENRDLKTGRLPVSERGGTLESGLHRCSGGWQLMAGSCDSEFVPFLSA